MKFVDRDGQRAFLFLSGRRSCVPDYKTPAFLHQTGGQRIQESPADSSTSSKQSRQNNCVMYVKLFTCTEAAVLISFCVCLFVFARTSRWKSNALTHHPPSILISAALSTSTPEGGSNQRAWFKSLGFKALGNEWTTLSHFSEKYSNLVHTRKSKYSPLNKWLIAVPHRQEEGVEPCQSCVHRKMFEGQLMVIENLEGGSFFFFFPQPAGLMMREIMPPCVVSVRIYSCFQGLNI